MSQSHGACLCGDLRFTAAWPSKWVAHCHCSMCRRGSGAAFVTWAGFEAAQVAIADPLQRLHWYASSPGAERGFCARCGAAMFFRSQRWPGEIHLTLGNFEDAVDRAPQAHVFWDTHVDWVALADALPRKP